MEKHINPEELIVAVLQGEDYSEAIEELNGKGFYVTILNSTGGFLRKKSVTVMIGVKSKDLDEAIEVLKHYGKRIEMEYHSPAPFSLGGIPAASLSCLPSIELPVRIGGVIYFVIDIKKNGRF